MGSEVAAVVDEADKFRVDSGEPASNTAAPQLPERFHGEDQNAVKREHLIEQLRAEYTNLRQANASLTKKHNALQEQQQHEQQNRKTLGASLEKLLRSPLWRWGRPAWVVARLFGRLNVGMSDLIPATEMTRDSDGTWRGTDQPQFLIPTPPLHGWVRLRAKLYSAVSSKACLYYDTGKGFHGAEQIDLANVAGDSEIDRMVALRKPAFLLRFDPVRAPGEFSLSEFSLEPVSSLWFNTQALWKNLKAALSAGESRPSIWRGLNLLISGDLSTFHGHLVHTVQTTASVPEYELWMRRNAITDQKRARMRDRISHWQNPPKISVVLPVYNVAEVYLRRCIDSVLKQIYPNWELCVADDASTEPHIKKVLAEYSAKDPRIKVVYLSQNGGISIASNAAMEIATGEYIALLDHDDELAEHALCRVVEAIVEDPTIDMLYSDEDKLTADGERLDPFFKPDWSPEYFLACMYTCHLGVFRTELIKNVGGWRSKFDGAQDYDLVLRMITRNPKIHHIPDVLYHWRTLPSSTASGASAKPKAHLQAQAALQSYLDLCGQRGRIEDGPAAGFHRVRYEIQGRPKVSIVIPSACKPIEMQGRQTWLVLECVASIRRLTTYENLEIIVLDDNDMSDELLAALRDLEVRRIPFKPAFNYSAKMNLGCLSAEGDHLVTLNDDVEVISPDWIESMLEFSQLPDIGAVGAQLLFPDNTMQHAGVTILDGNPGHPFYRCPADHPGYYFSSQVHRNWSAVTAACMMTRTDVFKSVGGFTESFPLNYNDVDYCLKAMQSKKRIVCVPFAKLYHHESLTKSGTYAEELAQFKQAWGTRPDPYYNPNLSAVAGDFRIG
jgi:glycosyltransferase involved in cell wall biosynthesis